MINQNSKILSKLNTLVSVQKSIEERLEKIEKETSMDNNDIVKDIIINVARSLLNSSIYPTQEEFRLETEKVCMSSYSEFYKKFRNSQWIVFYEKNIYQRLLAKHRSFRGCLTSKIKDAIYNVFPTLP